MNTYLKWNEKTITDLSPRAISDMYENGFVFTRLGKGVMQQTRSVRINLSKFKVSSENKRILKKLSDLKLDICPLPYPEYNFALGKLAKDFYEKKFGKSIMSAQKIKEMLIDKEKSNFNTLLKYAQGDKEIGFSICYMNDEIIHYSYPFYSLENTPKDLGLAMMNIAIQYAKDNNKKYIYLGSLQRPTDTYKLQFTGLEWFDGTKWNDDVGAVKEILKAVK
jgi:arginyl-tRNA--protein-N-Asp/Glu arginylyltransferase